MASTIEQHTCSECPSAAKYCCPACERYTCSLACCRAHKVTHECTGKRIRTQPVASKAALGEVFEADYHFLAEVDAVTNQHTALAPAAKRRKFNAYTPKYMKLLKAAKARRVALRVMPDMFARHKQNTSYFQENVDRIYWRVEWIFHDANAKLDSDRISEDTPLDTILGGLLAKRADNVGVRHRYQQYNIGLAAYLHPMTGERHPVTLLLKAEERPAADPRYYTLPAEQPLRASLAGTVVVEHPVVHVFLAASPLLVAYALLDRATAPEAATSDPSSSSSDDSDEDAGNDVAEAEVEAAAVTARAAEIAARLAQAVADDAAALAARRAAAAGGAPDSSDGEGDGDSGLP